MENIVDRGIFSAKDLLLKKREHNLVKTIKKKKPSNVYYIRVCECIKRHGARFGPRVSGERGEGTQKSISVAFPPLGRTSCTGKPRAESTPRRRAQTLVNFFSVLLCSSPKRARERESSLRSRGTDEDLIWATTGHTGLSLSLSVRSLSDGLSYPLSDIICTRRFRTILPLSYLPLVNLIEYLNYRLIAHS